MDQNDIKNLPRNDQVIIGAGVLAFIASFLPYYGASASVFGQHESASTSAWHSWNVLALLLILAATVLAAAVVFAASSLPEMPVSPNFAVAGLTGVGTVILVIRSFTLDHWQRCGLQLRSSLGRLHLDDRVRRTSGVRVHEAAGQR